MAAETNTMVRDMAYLQRDKGLMIPTIVASTSRATSHYGMTGSRSQGIGYAVGATEPRRATCERSRSMPTNLRYLGLDVHAETIAVAVAEGDGEGRPRGILPHRPDAVTKLIRNLGPRAH